MSKIISRIFTREKSELSSIVIADAVV